VLAQVVQHRLQYPPADVAAVLQLVLGALVDVDVPPRNWVHQARSATSANPGLVLVGTWPQVLQLAAAVAEAGRLGGDQARELVGLSDRPPLQV
jgi:hypothetical protein